MFEGAIKRGMEVLDQHLGTFWVEQVPPDKLDMNMPFIEVTEDGEAYPGCGCVLAHLADKGVIPVAGEYEAPAYEAYKQLFGHSLVVDEAAFYGFWTRPGCSYYDLTWEWQGFLWARRAEVWPGAGYDEEAAC